MRKNGLWSFLLIWVLFFIRFEAQRREFCLTFLFIHLIRKMMGIKDWVLSQWLASSVTSSRPLSTSDRVFNDEVSNREFTNQVPIADDTIRTSVSNQENPQHHPSQQIVADNSSSSHFRTNESKLDSLAKIENLQIRFFRVLQRIGLSRDNLLVAKVLYRMQLATLIRAKEPDLKRANLRSDRAKKIATEQEASGESELKFSLKILVIGKTGVGKSATINSIFDQTKASTNAFHPGTDRIQEIVGTVNGIKITFVDTPGLLPSSSGNFRKNRKILCSIKRFIQRSPPDIVLFFERLDFSNSGYSDFPLLKLMTEVFGSSIWFNTVFILTHASSPLPEGPNGFPVIYESYVNKCFNLVQHYIHRAVNDTKIENPMLLVENHPNCRTDFTGEKILPNGEIWKSKFLLLCVCSKVLSDVNALLEFRDGITLGSTNASRVPSLPHLLSSFLKHRALPGEDGMNDDADVAYLTDTEEDEYDKLPPIRILTKAQFEKMTDNQKKEYLDELDYRETLFMKKQLKEELKKRRESRTREKHDESIDPPEPMQLPDIPIPFSFDSDYPIYRYRCILTDEKWLARPVLDPHGWDHDVGFDGINLETVFEIKDNLFTSVNGQMSKDKQDFTVQSEVATSYLDPRGPAYGLGLDVQSRGKDLIYTVRSNGKLKYLKCNTTECGLSMTSFGDRNYFGAKVEDSVKIGNRVELSANGGCLRGVGEVAYGGTLEAIFRGKDYPVRNDNLSLSLTALTFKKEMVVSGNLGSEFRLSRGTRMSFGANLNNRKMGQIFVKMNSSDHIEIAFIAVVSIFRALLKRRENKREAILSG